MKMMKYIMMCILLMSAFASANGQEAKQEPDPAVAGQPKTITASPESLSMDSVNANKASVPGKTMARKTKKSVKKAFLLSLLVPGVGEKYVGHDKYAKGFWAAEGAIWTVALFSKIRGEMWKNDYIAYSAQEAGSNAGREDDNYYQNIYEWPNSYWYNEDQWRQARELYPYDPAAQEAYVQDKLYLSPEDSWAWQTESEWYYYRNLRSKSRNSLHRISYSLGAAMLNRILSSVNAARLAKRYNKNRLKTADAGQWLLECSSDAPGTVSLRLRNSF